MTDEDRYCAKETASEEAARMVPRGGALTLRGGEPWPSGDFVFKTAADEEVVRLKPDGSVVVNPKWNATDAARVFWSAVEEIGRQAVRDRIANGGG